ncbi:hypothetical protein H6G91_09310 [Nostoc muscorum FACHB-395]|nr:hypothetical protein [Desmonostoc muscorum FACHB-395]
MSYTNAPTDELSRESDRLHEGHCEKAMSTTDYAGAPTKLTRISNFNYQRKM